jgi:hypothetical protein
MGKMFFNLNVPIKQKSSNNEYLDKNGNKTN